MNYDTGLEQQILGTFLRYPDSMKAADGLDGSWFYDEIHRVIYAELIKQLSNNQVISVPALAMAVGNPSYVASLVSAPSLLDVAGAISVLSELASRRLIDLLTKHVSLALDGGCSSAEALQILNPLITGDSLETRSMHDAGQVTEEILSDLMTDVEPFKTGIQKLDECMDGGMYPRKAYGIAARKKVGKTIMLGTISHNLNIAGVKHLFICGEMGEKEIHQRVLSRVLQIYPSAFRTGYADRPDIINKIRNYLKEAPKNAIYLDAPGITFDKLKHAVVTAHMRHGIKGFILDYWQLVAGKGGRDSEAYHLGEVAQWIAEIGRKLNLFSLTAAQINQDGNTRGGEGMRLAFDQVYHLQPIGEGEGDITMPGRWLEMMDTRYTPWMNVGDKQYAGLMLNEKGLYFE